MCACEFVCVVCPPPRLLITSGMIWPDILCIVVLHDCKNEFMTYTVLTYSY